MFYLSDYIRKKVFKKRLYPLPSWFLRFLRILPLGFRSFGFLRCLRLILIILRWKWSKTLRFQSSKRLKHRQLLRPLRLLRIRFVRRIIRKTLKHLRIIRRINCLRRKLSYPTRKGC